MERDKRVWKETLIHERMCVCGGGGVVREYYDVTSSKTGGGHGMFCIG